jgi:hypothetical protein
MKAFLNTMVRCWLAPALAIFFLGAAAPAAAQEDAPE